MQDIIASVPSYWNTGTLEEHGTRFEGEVRLIDGGGGADLLNFVDVLNRVELNGGGCVDVDEVL